MNDQFVGWSGGTQVFALSIPSTAPSGTWTWSAIPVDSGQHRHAHRVAGPKNQGYETGTFGRFRYVPVVMG